VQSPVTIVGAGLVGSLLATLLAQRGLAVDLYEKRADPRRAGFAGGRSINLALSGRGLHALRMAGLDAVALEQAVTMRGRIVHARDGATTMQPYGIDEREVNHSISRGGLNMLLLDAGEAAGVVTRFDARLVDANFAAQRVTFADGDDRRHEVAAPLVIGADGAGSTLRMLMNRQRDLGERIEPLGHGYKELEIPPLEAFPENALTDDLLAQRHAGEHFAIASNGLHIWPRGHCMCIALPNREGSFTVTLFLPRQGEPPSFASLGEAAAARAYFEGDYADALALMPDFDRLWDENPVGPLATLYLREWHLGGQALLVGDAAHAIVPFHGQGMNAGFEDAAILASMLAEGRDPATVFARYQQQRRPDADAIAAMALENYVEMRDGVVDPDYLRRRHLGSLLAARAPEHFMPRYRMVTFTDLPYAYCLQRGRAQTTLLDQLLHGHADLDAIDLNAAVRTLKATLPPLPHPV
jgi:kynurenine 3-monooxygenase